MQRPDAPTAAATNVDFQELLGYLNFSAGSPDPRFLSNLNELFGWLDPRAAEPSLAQVRQELERRLAELSEGSTAFADHAQATAVMRLALDELPRAYRQFHRDLLFHQPDDSLWRPLLVGRVCEAVLAQGSPWDERERIVDGAITQLNDYLGHRPVAVLSSKERIEPYAHERIRPIPLFVRGAGVGRGRYQEIVAQALEILRGTDQALLGEAWFDLELLDELALDPRAYDFDHPVNKRPNYHFGQWDPHHIDRQGRYRRFVVQQVTLDVLLERAEQPGQLDAGELLWEAAAVLAGTMLMASGTSGSGPDAHDSTTTLATLLPRIVAYRDRFYDTLVAGRGGAHGARLAAEAAAGKQPLAGARQHLNGQLARRRAAQLQHEHLARLFAHMGQPQAALRQAAIVSAASARMTSEIQCRLTTGHLAVERGELAAAKAMLGEVEEFLERAIACGALVDPWNALGFQGQFSLFPAPENSVPDHRLQSLIELVEQILGLYARAWSEAAARDDVQLVAELSGQMEQRARWWDQFATTSVESIESFSGVEAFESARHVAAALGAFHRAGAAAGDIGFWRKHVAHFNSPKAYALVLGALWQKPDPLAAMSLLMQWLSQAGLTPLKQGEYSFHALATRWLAEMCTAGGAGRAVGDASQRQALVRKFFDLVEANAEDFWQVPGLDLVGSLDGGMGASAAAEGDSTEDDDDAPDDLYRAAYDEMVYVDSTGDGVEADMLEAGGPGVSDFELEQEARRLGERLDFSRTVAALWKRAVLAWGPNSAAPLDGDTLQGWLAQAADNEQQLLALVRAVNARRIPPPSASRDSLIEFDRRRAVKDALIDKIVGTAIEAADAARAMRAALPQGVAPDGRSTALDEVLRAVLQANAAAVREQWTGFLSELAGQALLYVPPSKGGDPARMAEARAWQQAVRDLLTWLPRLGLLREACQLLEAARMMEASNPVGPGAISEYDRLFAAGYEALVESIVEASGQWQPDATDAEAADNDLVECLEQLTEALLKQWLAHSRTLRLSVLERVADDKPWQALVTFIERYGGELFTQRFLNMGNLRAILHQGVETWLTQLAEEPTQPGEQRLRLLEELGGLLPLQDAVKHLGLVIEAVAENYSEYRDYNSTTTQSDRGDLLYSLLDFLRLQVHYERIAWHLKPVMIAHAVLVRRGRSAAAEMWRRALAERTSDLADNLQNKVAELRKKYGMRLPTVSDRLSERFVRPLAVDRVRALVKPAMLEVRGTAEPGAAGGRGAPGAFELLEQETQELAAEPTGVGIDAPAWLVALEQEVDMQLRAARQADVAAEPRLRIPQAPLGLDEIRGQLTGWELHTP